MKEIVIIDALRTPVGKYRGALKDITAVELGTRLLKELFHRYPVKNDIHTVIFGNVLQAGNGQNIARQIALNSGLSFETTAFTVNEVCGSGLKTIQLAVQEMQLGKAEVMVAGGVENMSQAPRLLYKDGTEKHSLFYDGLTDAFSNQLMGTTAEHMAEKYGVSREEQDKFALASHKKSALAWEKGILAAEVLPLPELTEDEGIKKELTLEDLAALKPIFKENGTVTAGNASTINDGAATILLATKEYAEKHHLPYLGILKDFSEVGIDPQEMGISPIKAVEKLLQQNQLTQEDIDIFEINEAFAATSLVVEQELKLDPEKVNPYGGGISIGHAIGSTGSRVLGTVAHYLKRENKRYGVATLCIGGGLGIAALVENPSLDKKEKSPKFYQWTTNERLEWLASEKNVTKESHEALKQTNLPPEVEEHLIENTISDFSLPMGLVKDLTLDGKKYLVPLVTEEPSVVAACNYGVKMVGNFTTISHPQLLRGQIVFEKVVEPEDFIEKLKQEEAHLKEIAGKAKPTLYQRGGGVKDFEYRHVNDFVSLDVLVDVKDAMGANIINTILEAMREYLNQTFSEDILMAILSNDATTSLSEVRCEIPFSHVGGKKVAEKIAQASTYAKLDPKRGVTHNKGILNGVNGVVLATGNDTRQVASAIHAYACENGSYQGLSDWTIEGEKLVGQLALPLRLGIVGGATKVLPKAKAALEILDVHSSEELSQVVTAIGLAQNLAALKALVTTGIQKGHMNLQLNSLAMTVGATAEELPELILLLKKEKQVDEEKAREILQQLRS